MLSLLQLPGVFPITQVELAGLDDGRKINPKDAKGNVEVWLLQVEVGCI